MTIHTIFEHGSVSITAYEPPEGSGQPPYVELWYRTQLLRRERLCVDLPLATTVASLPGGFGIKMLAANAIAREQFADLSTEDLYKQLQKRRVKWVFS